MTSGGDGRAGAAHQEHVDGAPESREHRRDREREELEGVGAEAHHLDPALVLAHRLPDPARPRADQPPADGGGHQQVGERDPVEVAGVDHADQQVGEVGDVEAQAFLAAGDAARVLVDQDRARLRKGKRDHRERDPGDAQRDRAQHQCGHQRRRQREQHRRAQAPVPAREGDVGQVDAHRKPEGVAEGEQPGDSEEEVIAERDRAEGETEAEQLQGSRPRQRVREDARYLDVEEGRHGQPHQEQRDRGTDRVPGHAGAVPARPWGRTRRTIASSATTARSPAAEKPHQTPK